MGVEKKEGFVANASTTTVSFTAAWSYTDAGSNRWIVTLASDSIRATSGNGSFSVLVATVPNTTVNATTAFNHIYFVDQTQGVYYWNGSSITYVGGAPKGKFIDKYKNRLVVSGLASPNQSQVYLSKFLDGGTWTSGSLATDPVILTAGLQDASDIVTGLYGGYNDALIVFKRQSIFGLFGTDQTDFSMRSLNSEIGTIDQRSIQPFAGGLVFASVRGIEYYTGALSVPISEKIRNKLEFAINSAFAYRTWAQTGQSDWQSGAGLPTANISYAISVGDVTTSSFSVVENSSSAWSLGTGTDILVTGASLIMSTGTVGGGGTQNLVTNWNFESGETGFTRTMVGNNFSTFSVTAADDGCASFDGGSLGSVVLGIGTSFSTNVIELLDLSGNVIISSAALRGSGSITLCQTLSSVQLRSTDPQYHNKQVKLRIRSYSGSVSDGYTTTNSFRFGGTINMLYGFTTNGIFFDQITGDSFFAGGVGPSTGSFISQTFNTGFTSSTVQLQATWTVNDTTPYFEIQHSTSSTGPFYALLTGTGTNAVANRYVRYVSSITPQTGEDGQTTIDTITVIAKSSGTYFSAVNYAPNLSSWDTFEISKVDDGGTHVFSIRSSTNSFSVLSTTPTWTSISPNSVITISTGAYHQFKDDFSVTAATNVPLLQSSAINYYEGSLPPSMASAIFEDRYYLALTTTSTGSANDCVLVLGKNFLWDRKPVWSLWNMPVGSFVYHQGRLYHGNNQGNGKLYQDFVGYSADGSAYSAYIKTKDYSMGDISKDKVFHTLYLFAENLGDYDISTSYFINKNSTGYSLDTVSQDESDDLMNLKLPFTFASTQANFGRTISFKFENTEADNQMKLFGGVLVYSPRKLIK